MIKKITFSINGSPIAFGYARISMAHNSEVSVAVFRVSNSSLSIGDWVDIDIQIGTKSSRLFGGYVKQISHQVPDDVYEITAYDMLVRAKDYFIASDTPDTAYKAKNILAENLVGDILNMAGITSYSYDPTNFTFAVNSEVEVNLVGALSYIKRVADILAYTVWADAFGTVHFKNRRPYPMTGDVASLRFSIGDNILSYRYSKSDRDLRNRVVIYGNNVYAEASAPSPYLPSGYYKSVVLASPLINSQSFAQKSADYNLELLNRLTEELHLKVEGDPYITPWKVCNVSGISSQADGDWYIYSVVHDISIGGGYTCEVILRR